MEIELSEDQLKRWLGVVARLALILAGLFLIWTFIIQPFLNSMDSQFKEQAKAQAIVTVKQICSDIDSLNKLQQEPSSTNPSVQRMRSLLAAYESQTGQPFNISNCQD